MRVLVVGSGGREHALAWALQRSPSVQTVISAPGNPGTGRAGPRFDVSVDDVEALLTLAVKDAVGSAVDLVVVGPELPLTQGLADALRARGIPCFGPSAAAAKLEGSKVYAKELMKRYDVPTAQYAAFDDLAEAERYIERCPRPPVIKADGLAAGKGVIVAGSTGEAIDAARGALRDGRFGRSGARIVVEEQLRGEEVSVIGICDGERVIPLATSQDHKRAWDGDRGPNTGGMGAVSPAPILDEEALASVSSRTLEPMVRGMAADGNPFIGALYAGLMITDSGVKVLEYNVRFGDPEAQPLFMRLRSDLGELLLRAATGRLGEQPPLRWDPRAAVCVVMAAEGYPGPARKGDVIQGVEAARSLKDVEVFLAGVAGNDGTLQTAGGRVLGVTALGETIAAARERAYVGVTKISWPGVQYRGDIAARAASASS